MDNITKRLSLSYPLSVSVGPVTRCARRPLRWRCNGVLFAERALRHGAPPPQYSYHSMFVPAAESAALWRCKSCGKEVSNRWHHYHSHTAQRSMCPYCPATYSRIDTLRSHLRLKHAQMIIKH
ncbi:Fruitless, isoform B [Operophtera brumata]|uniref:Fruitless, isoform B n=1 Tax=Operophtera brumata TaxID=104452 RepID=A0A0L7LTX1_OPEBR|nr:Fruitless, isoform B [Operophtera brumata]